MAAKKQAKPAKEAGAVKALFYLLFLIDLVLTAAAIALYYNGTLSMVNGEVYSSIGLSFIFPLITISYLMLKGMTLKQIVREVGLSRDKFTGKAMMLGIAMFIAILVIEILLGVASSVSGVQLPTNVQELLGGTPLYFLLFGAFISPINEEIFFRGFLVKRIGIILSALVFMIFHAGYGSAAEFLGALAFGLIAGYIFKKTESLYATILGHMLVNLLTVLALIF